MSSKSSAGASVITLQFDLSLSLDIAEQEVQAAINAATNLLPSDLPAPPIYAKINPADAPILVVAVTSPTTPLIELQTLADTRLAQKISQLAGVGLVTLAGGHKPAVRVRADIRALSAHGLNIDDLRTTLGNINVNTPKGTLDGAHRSYTIDANDQIQDPRDYLDSVIAYKNGRPVRLADVAKVERDAENTQLRAWVNTTPAILLNVQRQPGANVIDVVDPVKALLPQLTASLPSSVRRRGADRSHHHDPRVDRGRRIRARARDRPRGDGDLPVPAQSARDAHSEPLGSALARRHFRRDVSVATSASTISP